MDMKLRIWEILALGLDPAGCAVQIDECHALTLHRLCALRAFLTSNAPSTVLMGDRVVHGSHEALLKNFTGLFVALVRGLIPRKRAR